MFWLIAVISFILWEFDIIGVYTMLGVINILLIIAVITALVRVIEVSTLGKKRILGVKRNPRQEGLLH